jgi:mono/diheme cytochrome c family protein
LVGESDFITDFEYGNMLYNNPRGISCASCHGEAGEGKKIVDYIGKDGKVVVIEGIDIRDKTLKELSKTVARDHRVMPKYYLTDEEVNAIYYYIQRKNFPQKFK